MEYNEDFSLSKEACPKHLETPPICQLSSELILLIETIIKDHQPYSDTETEPEDEEENDYDGYCGACRLIAGVQEDTPFIFTLLDIKDLTKYIQSVPYDEFEKAIMTHHPTRGYTYLHQLVWTYVHEKPNFKNPELSKKCKNIIHHLSFFHQHLFSQLVNKGYNIEEKESNTPLHESFRNVSKIKYDDRQIIHLFRNAGFDFNKKDSEGYSVNDYLTMKRISREDTFKIRDLTRKFKELENEIYDKMKSILPNHFQYCKGCSKELYRNDKILNFPDSHIQKYFTEDDIHNICKIIQLRQEVSDIYNQDESSKIKQNHDYIISIWKDKLYAYITSFSY